MGALLNVLLSRRKFVLAGLGLVFVWALVLASPMTQLDWSCEDTASSGMLCSSLARSGSAISSSTAAVHGLPSEYRAVSPDQQQCDELWGHGYLRQLATHQQAYCKAGSESRLQCFKAERLPKPWPGSDWGVDSICLAQGVRYKPLDQEQEGAEGSEEQKKAFRMQCRPRNFTAESLASEQAAASLHGFQAIDSFNTYWFETGVGPQISEFDFTASPDPSCTASSNTSSWTLLVRREYTGNIWHKLMELWQAMLTLDALRLAINPSTNAPWLSAPDLTANLQIVLEDDRPEQLDPWWSLLNARPPLRRSALAPHTCLGNVILPLAGSASPFWSALLTAVPHAACRAAPSLADAFVDRVLRFLELDARPVSDVHAGEEGNPVVVTVIDRQVNRKIFGLPKMMATLRARWGGRVRFHVVDFAAIELREQVRLVLGSDVLVGHHGAGLTHVLWLPTESAVVEILPPVFSNLGFRYLSRDRGHVHLTMHEMWPEEWNKTVNALEYPQGWKAPTSDGGWQEFEWSYMTEDEFVGTVEAAIRSQVGRKMVA
ncbi:hypothetical protein B0T25DRAFT_203085 [Lasiosphaeria hispida]|uniref:Glycosyltransferase 61 catalytic domain-containing protein n=1 Tax=Lasiosphaeria hispida TaxID=260671 RepID=A0AAJ0HI61_9PEZI|nr:hypothetical protein B0T25DRAFT_203085 [Lasiosphaeria hispida]